MDETLFLLIEFAKHNMLTSLVIAVVASMVLDTFSGIVKARTLQKEQGGERKFFSYFRSNTFINGILRKLLIFIAMLFVFMATLIWTGSNELAQLVPVTIVGYEWISIFENLHEMGITAFDDLVDILRKKGKRNE